jgi:hypothetical protein
MDISCPCPSVPVRRNVRRNVRRLRNGRRNSQLLGMPFADVEFSLGLDELRELTPAETLTS